ncbi:vacuolar cation/proton exchanger [Rhynchospora pubera]|uniref:Vacuolar cation/proton exchanger n=1 Tax=Rhynchospora pubera TaxID=906938 RepID=A0AAV8FCI7_9POAL|nr:vacuolar cation/proton exchanger [Rhynchospora pubera]
MASYEGISEEPHRSLEAGTLHRKFSYPNGRIGATSTDSGPHKPLSRHGRSALGLSATSLRKKSDVTVLAKIPCGGLRSVLMNLQEIFLNTKVSFLFVFVIVAFVLYFLNLNQGWVFAASLLGLVPLAERLSFLTEQLALYTGPTIGGLLNATCGNATELIISLFALHKGEIEVVKWSLLGSILSNLLLVLGSSLFAGGIKNLGKAQNYDKKESDVGIGLLFVGALCHLLAVVYTYAYATVETDFFPSNKLEMSRVCCIFMLVAYGMHLFFQLKAHSQVFDSEEVNALVDDGDDAVGEEEPVLTWWSAFAWLAFMTVLVAVLSEFIVNTIQEASEYWGLSISFTSIILLPIVGNAAEHAGAVMFAVKSKLDITLGVALGSATQISMFVIPVSVIVAWIMGIDMDLDFKMLETGSLLMTILVTALVLQDGTSNYMKGAILLFCYVVIAVCFLAVKIPTTLDMVSDGNLRTSVGTLRPLNA